MKVFSVTEVKVDGVEHLTNEEMTNLTRVPEGADLLTVDTASIKNALKSNPWVSSVQVHRQFPHTLVVQIVERDISAVVEVTPQDSSEIQYWAISSDGIWLMQIPSEDSPDASKVSAQVYADAKAALRITNVAYGVAPVVGAPCTDSSVQNALKVVDGLSSPLMDEVTSVSAQDAANTVLTLNNGLQIAFGEAKDIRTKERVCLELLEKYPDQITYINVRVVDRPTWRGLSS